MVERCKSGLDSEIGVLISKIYINFKERKGEKRITKTFLVLTLGKIYLKRYSTDLKLKSREDFLPFMICSGIRKIIRE